MNNRNIINILLTIGAISLLVLAYFTPNENYRQILAIIGVVLGFLAVKRIFNLKEFATKE